MWVERRYTVNELNDIDFEDGWTKAYNPVQYESTDYADDKAEKKSVKEKKKSETIQLLIIIQIIVSLTVLISAFAIKCIGGDIYNTVHKFYKDSLNREIIMSEEFEQYSIDRLFNADKD
jgi:hypothetical protein